MELKNESENEIRIKREGNPDLSSFDENQTVLASGRISRGSRESAFSSAGESEEGSQLDSTSDENSSGRSSANRETLDDVKLLNLHCNIVPETDEALKLVDEVRVRFLASLQANEDTVDDEQRIIYDRLDVEELRRSLPLPCEQEQSLAFRLISRFLNFSQILGNNDAQKTEKALCEATESLRELLKFRYSYQLSQLLPDQFCKEFYVINGMFPFGCDRQNLPVVYVRARVHRRWAPKLDEAFRRYVAWVIDTVTKSSHGAKVTKSIDYSGIVKDGSFGICFDCLSVSYSCLDMDFLRFLVRLLVQHYPTYCRYALCVDLPWLFRSVWKLVRSWLPEEAQNTVQLITSKELVDYIEEDQIPNSVKFNTMMASEKPASGRHKLPENWDSIRGIEHFAKDLNLSSGEVKQFKAHVEKVRKEYEQLGAI